MSARKIPQNMTEDEKLSWFMNRYGESLGNEVKCHAYGLIELYSQDDSNPDMADIEATIDIKEFYGAV